MSVESASQLSQLKDFLGVSVVFTSIFQYLNLFAIEYCQL